MRFFQTQLSKTFCFFWSVYLTLTYFSPMLYFCIPWRRQKTSGSLALSEGIEIKYETKAGYMVECFQSVQSRAPNIEKHMSFQKQSFAGVWHSSCSKTLQENTCNRVFLVNLQVCSCNVIEKWISMQEFTGEFYDNFLSCLFYKTHASGCYLYFTKFFFHIRP